MKKEINRILLNSIKMLGNMILHDAQFVKNVVFCIRA